jgi:hypothetical protein
MTEKDKQTFLRRQAMAEELEQDVQKDIDEYENEQEEIRRYNDGERDEPPIEPETADEKTFENDEAIYRSVKFKYEMDDAQNYLQDYFADENLQLKEPYYKGKGTLELLAKKYEAAHDRDISENALWNEVIRQHVDQIWLELAVSLDQFSEDYDPYEYRDRVEDRDENIRELKGCLSNGSTAAIQTTLQDIVECSNTDDKEREQAAGLLERVREISSANKEIIPGALTRDELIDSLHIGKVLTGDEYCEELRRTLNSGSWDEQAKEIEERRKQK